MEKYLNEKENDTKKDPIIGIYIFLKINFFYNNKKLKLIYYGKKFLIKSITKQINFN